MTLRETILGMIEKHDYWTDGSELAADEITVLIEDFTQWCIINAFYQVFKNEFGLIDSNLHFKTASDLFEFWKLNVKETKDTITDVDLKQIDQARDDYYKRDKLFERKK